MSAAAWTAAGFIIPAIAIAIAGWRSHPWRRNETSDAISQAMESFAGAGEHMTTIWLATLAQQTETNAILAGEISEIKNELSEHRGMLVVVLGYVGRLRQQARERGYEPHEPPDELLHMIPD